ncbi:MAG TPA: hypothetical protein VH835_03960 [Dongiaceae bacterium]
MLEGEDWAQISILLDRRTEQIKEDRKVQGSTLDEFLRQQHDEPLSETHFKLTGVRLKDVNAIYHHRVDLFGPPCKHCGKPLRTPQAKLCAECGAPRIMETPD